MKILLTAHHAEIFRGAERFNYVFAKHLSKTHQVYFYSNQYGEFMDEMEKYAKRLEGEEKFDFIIASHNTCYRDVMHMSSNRIFISHGVQSSLDVPPGDCVSLGVSEEARIFHHCDGVISNPVDTEEFYPSEEERGKYILYYEAHPTAVMLDVLTKTRLPYEIYGEDAKEKNPGEKLRKAPCVIAGARGALEAMACKTPVLIYKSTGFDGWCGEYWELKKNNFSGRRYGKDLTKDSFLYEYAKINQADVEACYDYVIEHHSMENIMYRLREWM